MLLCSTSLTFSQGLSAQPIKEISTVQQLLSQKQGEVRLAAGQYVIQDNAELPEGLILHAEKGVRFSIAAGRKLTVRATIIANSRTVLWEGEGEPELYPTAMMEVSVCHFGAMPGDNRDDADAILKAVRCAQRIGTIYFPAHEYDKPYLISKTIEFFSPLRISNWHVVGDKTADGVQNEEMTSRIVYTATSGPCFSFRGQRLGYMANLNIEGLNKKPQEMVDKKRNSIDCWNPDNWNSPGIDMSKYNAHSAVAFDWDRNAGGNGAPWSAQFIMEKCRFSYFAVGINISPNTGYQADTYKFRDVKLWYCTYGVSIGQDQARSIDFENMWMDGMYAAYVNNRFGRGNGSAFNVTGGQYTTIFRLLETTTAYRGQCHFSGLFLEGCGMLGTAVGLGVNNNALVFTGCEFGLDNDGYSNNDGMHWVTPLLTFQSGSNVLFNGCNFNVKKEELGFDTGDGFIQFNGCAFGTLKRFFFANQNQVSFTGRSTYREQDVSNSYYPEETVPMRNDERYFVRPAVKQLQLYSNQAAGYSFQTLPARCAIPAWYPAGNASLPASNARQFNITLPAAEAARVFVGDYLNTVTDNGLKVSNMNLGFGGLMIPGLKVVAKNGQQLTLQRISPEMKVAPDQRTGQVYAWFTTFATGAAMKTLGSGKTVTVSNARLRAGDIVRVHEQLTRVLRVEGNQVSFADEVPPAAVVMSVGFWN